MPSEADIQQAAAYALRVGTSRAFLVYPSKNINSLKVTLGHVTVRTLSFDLSTDPDSGGKEFLAQLFENLP